MDVVADGAAPHSDQLLDAARRRLYALGHDDARLALDTPELPFDLVSAHAVARVADSGDRIDLEGVQRFAGDAAIEGKVGCLFSTGGFTDGAIAWADRSGIALFLIDAHGDAEPIGRLAADAVARSAAVDTLIGTGDLADPVEVAALLTTGLVGGAVGEVDLWFGGAGQVLTFWTDPGDRETAASVMVALYPEAVGVRDPDLGPGWEWKEHRLPGGGKERVWVHRCAHANQPPTVVAGEALAVAAAALDACGVELEQCRLELRPPAELDEHTQRDVHIARQTVLGPLGHGERRRPTVGETADTSRIASEIVERARNHRVAGLAEVAGLSADEQEAWRFVARLTGRGRLGPERWEIEIRVPGHLLEPDGGSGWLRSAKVTVGGSRWTRHDGQWCTTITEDDLEIAAQEAVAELVAAYAVAGEALEGTTLRHPR